MSAINSSKVGLHWAGFTFHHFEEAGYFLHSESPGDYQSTPRNRQSLYLPLWEPQFTAPFSIISLNTNLEDLGKTALSNSLWLKDSKEKFPEDIISQCGMYTSPLQKSLASFMTWIANVWVSCSKPMKYKTLGRTPNLFKVPRQWCQLLFCSGQLSLASLWITNKMELEEIVCPGP